MIWSNDRGKLPIREGAKRKVLVKDPIFGGRCVPKSQPVDGSPITIDGSPITRVLQVVRRIKRAKTGGQ